MSVLYRFGRSMLWLVFRAGFRVEVIGLHRLPSSGGLLIVANHISLADPPFLGAFLPRPVGFMAMAELFRRPGWRWIMRKLDAFPVDRTRVDHGAAREAVRRLRAGQCVAIFPEGGLRDGRVSVLGGAPEFRPGAGAIAWLGRAAIAPVIIEGTPLVCRWQNWLRRPTLRLTVGPAFCVWSPTGTPRTQARRRGREVVREALLKTVALARNGV